jgi:hypothetical protein
MVKERHVKITKCKSMKLVQFRREEYHVVETVRRERGRRVLGGEPRQSWWCLRVG